MKVRGSILHFYKKKSKTAETNSALTEELEINKI